MIRAKGNWTFVEGYVDEGLSGTSTVKRYSFNKMIKDAINGNFDLIVTKEVSRFARDTLDSIKNTRKLLSNGVGVYFINDNINTLDPDSELRLTIMTSLAQDEVRKLSERVKFGYQRAIKRGRVLGNSDIWGYEKQDGKLIIVPHEAKMIQRLFELYTTGKYGLSTVSKHLFNEGYKNKNGKPLSFTTIANIIRNPKYKGYYCGNKSTIIDYKLKTKIKKDKADWIIYKDYEHVPPIISEAKWELANKIYQKRSHKTKATARVIYQNRYNFSGKIICNEHQRSFHRKVYKYKTKNDEVVWICPYNNMRKEDKCQTLVLYEQELIKILRNVLTGLIKKKQYIIYRLSNLYRENIKLRDFELELNQLNRDLNRIKSEKDKLLNLSIDGIINDNEFKVRNDNCNDRIKHLEIESKRIKTDQQKVNNKDDEISKLELLIKAKIRKPTVDMLVALLDKIIVYNSEDKIVVRLKLYLKIGSYVETNYINPKAHHLYSYDPYGSG